MAIDPRARIAGLPLLRVRDALRRLDRQAWSTERLRELLRADPAATDDVLATLTNGGLVEPAARPGWWQTTRDGERFAQATARPVSRAAARRHVDAFLARLVEVRDDDRWLYRVHRAHLFGSFLDPATDIVGTVDLAVELVRKEPDEEVHRQRERAYIQRQWDDGRIFRSFHQERMCPSEDVLRYLKRRSWILNLHLVSDFRSPIGAPSRLLYEDPGA